MTRLLILIAFASTTLACTASPNAPRVWAPTSEGPMIHSEGGIWAVESRREAELMVQLLRLERARAAE